MQNFSFTLKAPLFDFNGWRFGLQIFSFENMYELLPEACVVEQSINSFDLRCHTLTWASGQEPIPGSLHLRAQVAERQTTFWIDAQLPKTIRCVKLVLKDLPMGVVTNLRETERRAVPNEGLLLKYPDGWRALSTALVVMDVDQAEQLYFRSLDTQVRAKRFAFVRRGEQLDLELIYEGLATEATTSVTVPAWEIGFSPSKEQIIEKQLHHVQQAYGLVPWEQREDIPAWAREIALVATIHCQHWNGYIFNDYARVLETLHWLAEKIDGKRILAYLPGWEGRYYWQYGDYRPDPRMGGEEGFAKLATEARRLGVHLMPMFGINYANRGMENYEQWGLPAEMLSVGGYDPSNSEDWDTAREHNHGWQRMLNPGAPTWQTRLATQVRNLIERYGFDGVFFDIAAGWVNDPRYDVYTGTVELMKRVRDGHPEVLIAGEGWYDAIGNATPLVQSGHTRGVLNWHDLPYAPFFDTYQRSFAHLCLGDPGRTSAGTHEVGYLAYNPITRVPLRKGIIPTVSLVEDTLQTAPEKVLEIIEDAKTYIARYL